MKQGFVWLALFVFFVVALDSISQTVPKSARDTHTGVAQTRKETGNLALVKLGDKYGFINESGHYVINSQFDMASQFTEGLAGVRIGDKWGYIDRTGKFIINPHLSDGFWFSDGLAWAGTGFVDKTGTVVIHRQPGWANFPGPFHYGLAVVGIWDTERSEYTGWRDGDTSIGLGTTPWTCNSIGRVGFQRG
jgi:hypothetical protein